MDRLAHPEPGLRLAADAMCGGLARWLRLLGVDTTHTPGIEDGALLRHALAEDRLVLSADRRLFERRLLAAGRLRGLLLPVGLRLHEQVAFVVGRLMIRGALPRCAACNGELAPATRAEVAGEVPARSLIWTQDFCRCGGCGRIFWEGTHWRRIRGVMRELAVSGV